MDNAGLGAEQEEAGRVRADRKPPKLERHTARPLEAYRISTRQPEPYTAQFSRALGLRPAATLFGKRKVNL